MQVLAAGLQAHLDTGTTTMCHCWRVAVRNGETLGFTDHDHDLIFDGTVFESQSGFTGSEIQSSLGLSVDNMDATGALQSNKLDEERLRAGDFDHAEVEIWRVNWQDVAQRVLMRKGHLGEVTAGSGAFSAEVRGLAHLFNQQQGRLYQYGCDADVGDARCGVDLDTPAYRGQGTISFVDGATLSIVGLNAFADDWFTRGTLTWTAGANAGRILTIRRHRLLSSFAKVDLWRSPPFAVTAGELVTVRAGCNKQFSTCKAKFNNTVNFRGFPHMPGNDFVMSFAAADDPDNDGARRRT